MREGISVTGQNTLLEKELLLMPIARDSTKIEKRNRFDEME